MSDYYVIEAKARLIIKNYGFNYLIHPQAIPIEEIIEKSGLTVDYQYLTKNGDRVLGKLICTNGLTPYYDMEKQEYLLLEVAADTILVEARLREQKKIGRLNFTLAHEFAHWLLHRNILTAVKNEAALVEESDEYIERQADLFASELLMPTGTIKKYFYHLKCKKMPDDLIIAEMADVFKVSERAMRIKLVSRNLIEDKKGKASNGIYF